MNISNKDLREKSYGELKVLCAEIRKEIINTTAETGGHLASNLGIVEATVALHRTFDSPDDKIVFDVGHQCYAHKILTGRGDRLNTLRQYGGISGFPKRGENENDILTEGHSGTAISAAIGIAVANKINGSPNYAVAVVGDGAFTNGMVYEALNNCGGRHLKLIILLNDNGMSIGANIGSLHNYFGRIRTSNKYFKLKRGFKKVFSKIPLVGKPICTLASKTKDLTKRLFNSTNLFEDMGLKYIGPVDGNDIEKLCIVLDEAKRANECCIVHIKTQKGKGYALAEEDPEKYHAVGKFNPEQGAADCEKQDFSWAFGEYLCEKAKTDDKICAVTAAMRDGTGLAKFSREYPNRFFDVGIAEEHAITFCGGLSVSGLKPVCAIYSTFAQRSFDQLFHDISIQKLNLTLVLDRCGIVAGDGITHQGIFDYGVFSVLPDIVIYSPQTYAELRDVMDRSLASEGLNVVRYPKGVECVGTLDACGRDFAASEDIENCEAVIVTYGRITELAERVRDILKSKVNVGIVKLLKICPVDCDGLFKVIGSARVVYVLEENAKNGGVGEKIVAQAAIMHSDKRFYIHAIEGYVEHGDLNNLFARCGFTTENISRNILELCSNDNVNNNIDDNVSK